MNEKFREAVELFEEVVIYGKERVLKYSSHPLWSKYSPEQIQVLKILATYGKATSSELAQLQSVHKSAISSRVRKLLEKKLISIQSDQNDRRMKYIFLTDKGKHVLQLSREAIYKQFESIILEQFDEKEIDRFIVMFRRLKEILLKRSWRS